MRTSWVSWGVAGVLAGLALSEVQALRPPPGDPSVPVLQQGAVPGQPPGLLYPGYSAFAEKLQLEWLRSTGSTTALFASSWYPENYQSVWLNPTTTVSYLKSPTGPGACACFRWGPTGCAAAATIRGVRELGDVESGAGEDAGPLADADHLGPAADGHS
jgi:hypothetical protein